VKVHEGGLAAGLGIEVGRTGGDALVEMHDVPELRVIRQRIEQRALGRAGIAEDSIDPVIDQRLQQNLTSAHSILSL